MSSFVGALSLFGKDNLGKIEEINVKGLDVDMVIVYKYDLFLIAILSHEIVSHGHDIRAEAAKALEMFYSSYVNEINNSKECVDISMFDDFKKLLFLQIQDYLEIIDDREKEKDISDFGWFSDAIKKHKEENTD